MSVSRHPNGLSSAERLDSPEEIVLGSLGVQHAPTIEALPEVGLRSDFGQVSILQAQRDNQGGGNDRVSTLATFSNRVLSTM